MHILDRDRAIWSAQQAAKLFDASMCVVVVTDGNQVQVVSWGKTTTQCGFARKLNDKIMDLINKWDGNAMSTITVHNIETKS